MSQLDNGDQKVHILKFLEKYTIKRLARFILIYLKLENVQIGTISNRRKIQIMDTLYRFNIEIEAVEESSKAYVNGGGVLVSELNPKSFESKKLPGLYFIGEAVDVHGPIGGFNVTIALSTGVAASSHVKEVL